MDGTSNAYRSTGVIFIMYLNYNFTLTESRKKYLQVTPIRNKDMEVYTFDDVISWQTLTKNVIDTCARVKLFRSPG